MKPRIAATFALILAGLLCGSLPARADYPIASHRYLADPASLVHGERIYLYSSNDDDNPVEGGYEMSSIVCISSGDLKNWTDHGEVLRVPRDASWAEDSWAPYTVERDGTIYMYFGNSASGVGVASSDSPTGKFKDAKGGYLINSSTPGASGNDSWLFDPGGLIDDDGKAYLAFGGNKVENARMIALGADLVSVVGSATPITAPGFYEAAFMFKRNGIYYLSYSTNPDNGLRIDYLTSQSPMSGYTYRGVLAGQPPVNENNNHASEFEFKGKWYHAYHNRYVSTQAGISTTYKRNLALEVLEFNADGSIVEVEYTTDGVPQLGTLDPYVRVEAETTNAQKGIETEPCSDGGMNVTDIDSGDWVRVRGVDFGATGAKSFSARVASAMGGGSIELRLDGESGMLLGTCSVPATGGAQTWVVTTCDVTGATGTKDLYLKFTGGGFGVDSWQFHGVENMGGSGGAPSAQGGSGGTTGGSVDTGGSTSGGSPVSTGGTPASAGSGGNVSATGGTTPTGGVAPTTGGSGGTPSTGGTPTSGTPGMPTGGGGTAPVAMPAESSSSSGCSCRVGGASHGNALLSAGIALALLLWRRRSSTS